ncbi:ADP-ribosylation/Crystallin J1 [Schizophyllum amplum]|uniref:ADP-ribosylhydrolase ARH3 n=1 Tax=Schizophyllum amplum TaxID=97359 RepID=A0A550C2A3_9AGAR|nr:ADP-ribosylation/Crystallin J1 [Auriculariopsis ampla]
MRVLPIGLAYWRDDAEAQTLARRSSTTTHPAEMCQEACALWASLIARIVRDTASGASLSKLDLLHLVSEYPYADDRLRASLSLPADSLPCPTLPIPRETHYWAYHPILQLVANTSAKAAAAARNRTKPSGRNLLHYFPSSSTRGSKANLSAPSSTNQPAPIDTSRRTPASTSESTSPTAPAIPSAVSLPSTGFVLDTLRAALYCFFATDTFESGAVMAVNLGDDADTVGAVYGGLAGVWYGVDDGEDERTSSEGLFWSSRVREWVAALRARELIDEVASELVNFVEAQYPNTVFDER